MADYLSATPKSEVSKETPKWWKNFQVIVQLEELRGWARTEKLSNPYTVQITLPVSSISLVLN